MPLDIGFTGTKDGMTDLQKSLLGMFLDVMRDAGKVGLPVAFHHGFCDGADKEAEVIAIAFGFSPSLITRWLPESYRTPLERDKAMVHQLDMLIAAPGQDNEILRSGTWSTVRYGRDKGIPIIMLPRQRRTAPTWRPETPTGIPRRTRTSG